MSSLFRNRFTKHLCLILLVLALKPQSGTAEGSKELNANGGNRAFLVSTSSVDDTNPFPTRGTVKVYVKENETLNVGSSAQGDGTINLRAPNGATYTSGNSATIGFIKDRAQEKAGPLPNINGYTPYTHVVSKDEVGVWEVDFIPKSNSNESPKSVDANADWENPSGQYIAAFDVSVRNATNTAFLTGRVYTNVFLGILGAFDVGFNGIFYILTNDGYQYRFDNNGQAGNGFSFFVNNKGFRQADGTASYKSVNSLKLPNIQDPRSADTQTDITHKIFFNAPAADLPATANVPGGGSTWLLTSPVDPSSPITPTFTGTEGTANVAGTAPLGGKYAFTASKNGTYLIAIDVNKNGVYTDAIDRKLTGNVIAGQNQVTWDGLDGLGNKVPAGSYNSNVNVTFFGGEVHFPFLDVERNVNGIRLTRLNGVASPDFTIYWDDSQITTAGTPSNPLVNLTGLPSVVNGHAWGTPGAGFVDFGDQDGIDTWAYIAAVPVNNALAFRVQEADLETTAITTNAPAGGCVGQTINYTFSVRNNGPSDVAGAKFSFAFPATLTDVTVASTATGTSTVSNEVKTTTGYSATLTMLNGASRTYTITGKIAAAGTGNTTVAVTAGILRMADLTDPDATNPDAAPPTDAAAECDAAPSGTGCNNIKTNSLTFLALPDVGTDKTIVQDEVATFTDTNPGTWAQVGSTPLAVLIATPAALTTTVTGFKDVGKYQFTRTNAAGCIQTLMVTVVPKSLDIPTVFTPNGDGKNDTFNIPGITSFPGSQLIIINRWGNEVYRSNDYQNTWSGEGLTEGVYYYVLNKKEVSGSFTTIKGWVFLKR
ncbi:gliding motility-associated C-terminal domain-containing protein [Mucilaginibacter mali]|uniref:Gliding motility-associated C-terminal domain-containing protein n=1 Tax=Mucilaginibacter mali TaxID=2740462 RepID=A0A7D4QHJ1_9SPHI|nr:gliding motility-associated C-terminal domain-containing protein [Mucilaginibacter mali]QKJ32012.1 gliding motility-associated C-terminal domain-containing protein [Mucilaginibacter mali]